MPKSNARHTGALMAAAAFLTLFPVTPQTGSASAQSAAAPNTNAGTAEVSARPPEATAKAATGFSHVDIVELASQLARKPFEPTRRIAPRNGELIGYDAYRGIRFRPEKALWREQQLGFEVQLLPTGWIYDHPIELHIVENGEARRIEADPELFRIDPGVEPLTRDKTWALSGFRITAPLNTPSVNDEIVVFQGASYYRALSKGQAYGLSARGLAIGVGRPSGEEFPFFKAFWIEKPEPGAKGVLVHALLDSPSLTGAYLFAIEPGQPTRTDVTATLFARTDIPDVGLAPLTSMNVLSTLDQRRIADFRPRIHDSDGLAILTGRGERIWRPLNNPKRLQFSLFSDLAPKGFGLAQRERSYEAYLDLEADYERRPSSWVEPLDDWGPGHVVLVEIPSEEEIHDNIVAYWRPTAPLRKGVPFQLRYRMSWPDHTPNRSQGPFILRSRAGPANGAAGRAGKLRFVVDYAGLAGVGVNKAADGAPATPKVEVSASQGKLSDIVVQTITGTSGTSPPLPRERAGDVRVSFLLDPAGADLSELRIDMSAPDGTPAETWLYRWTSNR